MAGAAPLPGKGAKRSLDVALNIVPFIDLLSCCLAFLLITAVWTQLAAFEVAPGGSGEGGRAADAPSLTLYVDEGGHTLSRSTGESDLIPRRGADYDYARLADRLGLARQALPGVAALTVRASDPVRYEEIIRTMDVAKGARFSDVAVAATE